MLLTIPRQILFRIGLLLAGLVAILIGALVGLALLERHFISELLADERAEHGRMLDDVLTVTGKPLRLFVEGYARRTSFTRPDEEKHSASAESTLNAGLRTHELSAAWVLEADGQQRIHTSAEGIPPQLPPLSAAQIARLQSHRVHFFMESFGTPYEIRGSRLAASGTSPNAPRGWLIAARRLDDTSLATVALSLQSRVTFVPPNKASPPPFSGTTLRIERILHDFAGRPAVTVLLDCTAPEIEIIGTMNRLSLVVICMFGLGAVGLCAICLWRWIILPATVLRRSLTSQDPTVLEPLIAAGGDLGLLGELVRDSMDARRQLEQTLDEHARLSRDLHDGVIQTIYAAGMNVAGARALLASNPAAVDERLDRACLALNAAVHDVRNFILGLEPEPSHTRTFRQNVEFILSLLRPIRPIDFHLEIDDDVCTRFTPEQKRHTLQIVREALSNSLRHSTATCVTVRVHAQPDGSILEIEDNGTGFDLVGANDGGRGLKNLAARASEIDGALSIGDVEPKGTRVRLTLPPISAP